MKSSAEEWHTRGINLMEALRFEFAAKAFLGAGDPVRAAMAGARHALVQAREKRSLYAWGEARALNFEVRIV